MRTFNE
jgi:hypothetical protein